MKNLNFVSLEIRREKENNKVVKRITEMDKLETPGGGRFHLKLFTLMEYKPLHVFHLYPPTPYFSKMFHIHNCYMLSSLKIVGGGEFHILAT